jgi:2-polyprenyl-3-methyl-5-hydroxy-6-metoxy-1,4-benzoquinol methylase
MTITDNKLRFLGNEINTKKELIEVYKQSLQKTGFNGMMMGYFSEEYHLRKVAQFACLIAEYIKSTDSVLDIGCGYGSLAALLPQCEYHGIDLVSEFVNEACKRFPHLSFETVDLERHNIIYNWCVLVGVVSSVPNPESLLQQAWERCETGIIVDFTEARKFSGELNTFDIGDCVNWFLSLGAKRVEVLSTSEVWTILIVRKKGRWKAFK